MSGLREGPWPGAGHHLVMSPLCLKSLSVQPSRDKAQAPISACQLPTASAFWPHTSSLLSLSLSHSSTDVHIFSPHPVPFHPLPPSPPLAPVSPAPLSQSSSCHLPSPPPHPHLFPPLSHPTSSHRASTSLSPTRARLHSLCYTRAEWFVIPWMHHILSYVLRLGGHRGDLAPSMLP